MPRKQKEVRDIVKDVAAATAMPREPGDNTATEQPAEQARKSSWAPRSTLSIPIGEEAKKDASKGEVLKLVDGFNAGVGIEITSPDPNFKPSPDVLAPIKAEEQGTRRPQWTQPEGFPKKLWHKKTREHPVAVRLDMENRAEAAAERLKAEREKASEKEPGF